MRPLKWVICLLLLAFAFATPVPAQFTSFNKSPRHTKARLLLSHDIAKPGEIITAAIELTMDERWHTYWENGGDSGMATSIHWDLPKGLSAASIRWPVPERFTDKETDSTTFVYHDRAVLLVPLTIAKDATAGTIELNALAKWLECEVACVPGSNLLSATLTIGNESKPSTNATLISQAQRQFPSTQLPGKAVAHWDAPASVAKRPLLIEWNTDASQPDFFPNTHSNYTVSAKTDLISTAPGKILMRKIVEKGDGNWPTEIRGLLVRKENEKLSGYEVTIPVDESTLAAPPSAPAARGSFGMFLLYAFIGGLILNIMPCVLPVIALKILGFVQQSGEDPKSVRVLGLLYALGVVASFLVLAGFVIGLKATGQKAGWGMQFSNPQFIVVLTTIVTLVALNLFGIFEVTLGNSAMSVAGQAASRHGGAGAFMNGVLATTLATPCTAPFLGPALGFAFAQPAPMIVLFFVTIALGLALPYIVLSWNPKLLKLLPRPGVWMERFKNAMGFPMLATAVWLFTLTITHYGNRVVWLGVFLVLVAFAAWVFGQFIQRGRSRRGLAMAIVLLLLGGGVAFALEAKLRWREPNRDSESGISLQESPDGILWEKWSAKAVADRLAEKRPVLVDFTAQWCFTCNTVVKPALESSSVRQKLKALNVAPLLADYTKFPPEIGAELERFGRAGVPLVIVYPKDSAKPPIVLPEAITPGMVVKALEEAAK